MSNENVTLTELVDYLEDTIILLATCYNEVPKVFDFNDLLNLFYDKYKGEEWSMEWLYEQCMKLVVDDKIVKLPYDIELNKYTSLDTFRVQMCLSAGKAHMSKGFERMFQERQEWDL